MIVALPPPRAQPGAPASYILHERASEYFGAGAGFLSIKSFFGGVARYSVGRARYAVGDRSYLLLNHGQPYSLALEGAAPVESFCVFFAPGFAEQVRRSLSASAEQLLSDPARPSEPAPLFERTYPHDELVSPALLAMRRALAAGVAEPAWLDERMHALMAGLLAAQGAAARAAQAMPAARPATRAELYRRLHLARDYAEAMFAEPVALADLADVAGMSANHLLRSFRQAFGQTPHQYISALRLARARELLAGTDLPVTEICLAVGFTSLGSFSWRFRRSVGLAPAEYRLQTR